MVNPDEIYEYLEWSRRPDRLPEEWAEVQHGEFARAALTAIWMLADSRGGVSGAAAEIEEILSEYASGYRTVE